MVQPNKQKTKDQLSKPTKRPTIWDLREQAKKRYPEKAQDSWWVDKYAEMCSWIIGIEKDFSQYIASHNLDVVKIMVERERHVTRSPGKLQAIKDWEIDRNV